MKKTKFLALILCLSFLCTLLLPATAYADNPPAGSGMKYSKTATANNDGSLPSHWKLSPPARRPRPRKPKMSLRISFWCWISPAP